MPTLDKTLRAQLERDIKKARGIAETAPAPLWSSWA